MEFSKGLCCNKLIILPVVLLLVAVLESCSGGSAPTEEERKSPVDREELVSVNRQLVAREADLIQSYAGRRNWDMEKTGSGLHYQIYGRGDGQKIETGNQVEISYTVSLLDGTVCYSSEDDGNKTFRVGQGGVEAGLEEGILLLRVGDKARFIIPSYLAHGLIGDQNRIPPRSVIVYEIEVFSVNQ